ncbi:CPBP family intramembrane glutamic endopeptidase [Nocardiopsis aegyptia]|uniref:Membrane protease YdiL (CAAX protease family) n=1 Tax=Nocardiopsis aegyptia TaxID=220378 RepID=A0A7Z0EN25_9ACTN|nr:type II CAAX endopeptidase family protein [Nocardiopsis aegyptia]NYJ34914.1 membrane protease YdiL (CAAX protease family) [Nocardiopsis aegyptia]
MIRLVLERLNRSAVSPIPEGPESARRGRSRSWWAIIAQCAAGLLLYVGVSLTVGMLSGSAVLGVAVSGPVVFGAVAVWRRRTFGAWSARLVSDQAKEPRFWVFVLVGLVMCFLGSQSLAVWLYDALGSPAFDTAQSAQNAAPVALLLLALVVAAPAGEEALMRGLIHPLLRRRWPVAASALASSAVFAALHGNLVQVAVALPLGVLLAFVYEHVGRLWPVVALHALFNLASVVVPVRLVEAMATPVVFSAVLLGAAAVLAVLHPTPGNDDRDGRAPSPP